MKHHTSLIVLTLSVFVVAGCSKHLPDTASPRTAFDTIEAGKDLKWRDGTVLHVRERDGTSLRGVQVTDMGGKRVVTADAGTIQRIGSDTVFIMLTNASLQSADGSTTNLPGNFMVELYR